MIWNIIVMLIVGLIAGFIDRAVVPGRDPMGIGGTLLLGLVGSFIGGFLGYLASRLAAEDGHDWRRAAVCGSVMASFQVEAFSLDRVRRLTPPEIHERYRRFRELTRFEDLPA